MGKRLGENSPEILRKIGVGFTLSYSPLRCPYSGMLVLNPFFLLSAGLLMKLTQGRVNPLSALGLAFLKYPIGTVMSRIYSAGDPPLAVGAPLVFPLNAGSLRAAPGQGFHLLQPFQHLSHVRRDRSHKDHFGSMNRMNQAQLFGVEHLPADQAF